MRYENVKVCSKCSIAVTDMVRHINANKCQDQHIRHRK